MATIRIAATGDKEKGINEINPRFQANALRNIRGIDCGVLANNFYSEDRDYYGVNKVQTDATLAPFRMISCASSGIQIGAGMATAYGYDFQIEESETVSVLDDGETSLSSYINNTSGTRYVFVYLEWDITGDPGIGSVKLHGNGTASIWRSLTTSNANLIDNPRGIYKLPIYRVEITNGTLTYVSWEDMNLCPTITRPQVAEVARFAEDPTGVGDEIANTRYVTNRCDEDLTAIQNALDIIYSNFSSGEFTVLGVPCKIKRQNGICYITSDNWYGGGNAFDGCTEWGKTLANMAIGDTLGNLPTTGKTNTGASVSVDFTPTEDFQVRAVMNYKWGTSTSSDGNTDIYFQFTKGSTAITLAELPSDRQTSVVLYPTFCFPPINIHWGYPVTPVDEPVIYAKHELILNYDSSKAHIVAPTYYEVGVPFTLKAIATGYGEECRIEVTNGSTDGEYGNGEFEITPTQTICVVSISTRYFNGGTDENGDDGVTSAPTLPAYTVRHEISFDTTYGAPTYGVIHAEMTESFTDNSVTAYTWSALYNRFGSRINVTGTYEDVNGTNDVAYIELNASSGIYYSSDGTMLGSSGSDDNITDNMTIVS